MTLFARVNLSLASTQSDVLAEVLRNDSLLSDWPSEIINAFIARGRIRHYEAGDVIHRKHAPSECLHRIISGAVRISSVSGEGREAIFSYYGPKDWFGHIGLLDGKPRTHDIHACGPCVLFNLPHQDFRKLIEQTPILYKHFALLLCSMIRSSFIMLEDRVLLNLSGRLAKHLITLVDAYGVAHRSGQMIALHIPQEDLSMLLGSTRQTINRKLTEWAKLGWIEIHYSQIVIVNRDALMQLYR
jgi:CRP/FNR family transcriptional regulator, cyclic AMP receptor protein